MLNFVFFVESENQVESLISYKLRSLSSSFFVHAGALPLLISPQFIDCNILNLALLVEFE